MSNYQRAVAFVFIVISLFALGFFWSVQPDTWDGNLEQILAGVK